jgi:hypothetical protein
LECEKYQSEGKRTADKIDEYKDIAILMETKKKLRLNNRSRTLHFLTIKDLQLV